jgi:heavy metal response regulator
MRILIVEDERKVAQFLKKGLQAESYSVDTAPDGERGSLLARSESYDLIILDVMLPRKDGFEVLREIRGARIATPVLMLTAKSDLDDRVRGLDLGADDYLSKPFSFSEVLARVRALLRRSGREKTVTHLQLADLSLDVLSRTTRRGDAVIDLTRKEYELLEYLLRNKGRVFSRAILTEHIWDMNFDSETNIVDVLVNRVRRKIDDGHEKKLLHTVRGVGYVLREENDETA